MLTMTSQNPMLFLFSGMSGNPFAPNRVQRFRKARRFRISRMAGEGGIAGLFFEKMHISRLLGCVFTF